MVRLIHDFADLQRYASHIGICGYKKFTQNGDAVDNGGRWVSVCAGSPVHLFDFIVLLECEGILPGIHAN
jgi:hypothetical protein